MSAPVSTPTLPTQPTGGHQRLELKLITDFGSEDLLLVQQELVEQLAKALSGGGGAAASAAASSSTEEQIAIVEVYGAGQYYLIDLPEELVQALVRAAGDMSNSLFDARVLGKLDSIKRLDGIGGTTEALLASNIQQLGAGYTKTSIADLIKLAVFLGGILLALGLTGGICYGVCMQGAGEDLSAKPEAKADEKAKAKAKKAKPDRGTAEETQSLAAADDEATTRDVESAQREMAKAEAAQRLADALATPEPPTQPPTRTANHVVTPTAAIIDIDAMD